MPKIWLAVPHQKQHQQADCLAMCAAMVLSYWGVTLGYPQLLSLLDIQPIGTPYSNILRLKQLGLDVQLREGELADLENHLQHGEPCIAFVRTSELSYWSENTGHAVVVVGIDEQKLYLNDPAFTVASQAVSHDEFMLAWLEFDYDFVVIKPKRI